MKKIILGMLVLLGLGACGGDGSKNQTAPTNTTTAATAAGTTVETIPTTTIQAEKVGKPFLLAQANGAFGPTTLQITIRRPVLCGFKGYAIPAIPELGESAKTIRPPRDMRFCEVDIRVKNVGKRIAQFDPSGFIYSETDEQYRSEDDLAATLMMAYWNGRFPGVNTVEAAPGKSGDTLMVFAIPVGAAPSRVEIEEGDGEPPSVAIAASDVKWKHPKGQ